MKNRSLWLLLGLALGCASGGDNGGGSIDAAMATDAGGPDAGRECVEDSDCPDDGIFCNGTTRCEAGSCVAAEFPSCDDGIACTTDRCVTATDSCQHTPEDGGCPSGSMCVVGQGCQTAPACEFDDACDDGVFCNGSEVCLDEMCQSPGRDCDDGNSCTMDECAEAMTACVNEPYDDVLSNPMHCGTGANDCLPCDEPTPEQVNVHASCSEGMCGLECDEGFGDVNDDLSDGCEATCDLSMPDEPDDAFEDTDCDRIDGDVSRAIFVALGGDDTADGVTPATPVATLGRALEIQDAQPDRTQILMETGTHAVPATLSVRSGVGIHGGYSADFRTRTDTRAVLDTAARTALSITSLTDRVVLDRLSIATRDQSSGSTIALVVRDAAEHLTLHRVVVVAGAGGNAMAGAPGGTGASGARGSNGVGSTGGSGGIIGGGAGRSGRRRDSGLAGSPGASNSSSCGGTAGAGSGSAGLGCNDGDPRDGGVGGSGCTGRSGNHGMGGSNRGSLDESGLYAAAAGSTGSTGGTGGGGGGGGAGGGEDCTVIGGCVHCGTGRGGAGGGGGGRGGNGGSGGRGGGASVGILLVRSTLNASGLAITTGRGGNGGTGGTGGAGGSGGSGGSGARSTNSREGSGGNGGRGGDGGRGGCGGGGGGGPSIGIWGFGSASRVVGSSVDYTIGDGGSGGGSCGNAGATGDARNNVDVTAL